MRRSVALLTNANKGIFEKAKDNIVGAAHNAKEKIKDMAEEAGESGFGFYYL